MNYKALLINAPVITLCIYYMLRTALKGNLPYIIGGVTLVLAMIILDRLEYIGITSQVVAITLLSIILAVTGYLIILEVLLLVLPFVYIAYCILKEIRLEYLVLASPIAYVYALVVSYLVDLGYGPEAPLLVIPLITRTLGYIMQGKIPLIVSYEPIPGIIPLYFTSILILLLIHEYKVPLPTYTISLRKLLFTVIPLAILVAVVHVAYRLIHVTITCLILVSSISTIMLYRIVKE